MPPPQPGVPQRVKQLAQGFLGVNLRKDRVTLADEELAKAVNAELHERPGTLLLRRGRRKQFGSALSDLAIRRLALVNGVRYQIAGQSLYRDAAVILNGALSPNLFTTMQPARPLTDRTTWVFIADEAGMYKDDGTRLVPWGGEAPAAPVVAVGGVGTGLTGDYLGGYTYIRFDDVDADGDPAVAHESNVAADDAVTLANNALAIGDIRDPTDSQVNGIGVYRSVIDGALLLLDSREEIPDESTTFSVTHGWEVTASPGGTAASGLQHHWSVDKETKRGTQAWEPVAAPGLRFIGSAAISSAASLTLPAHEAGDLLVMFAFRSGSVTAPGVPSGWTTWGAASGATLAASVGAYKVATSDAETSGEWTAATGLICHVYRGQRVAGAIGATGDTGGVGTTVTYPALNLTDTAGASLVVSFAGTRHVNSRLETAPNGMVNRTNVVGATYLIGELAGHDTDGGVATRLAHSVSVGGTSSAWRARSLELRAEPTTSDTAGSSEDANGYRGTHLWESVLTIPVTFVSDTNLVTNGAFDTTVDGWSNVGDGFMFWNGGRMTINIGVGTVGWAEQAILTVVGTSYLFEVAMFGPVGTTTVHVGTASQGDQITSESTTAAGAIEVAFTATATTSYIGISTTGGLAVDNVMVREITSGTPLPPVTTQTKRWAYSSIIADSALGAEGPNDHDAPPLASWVTEFQGHLVLVRIKDNPHHLRWSRRFAPEAWSPEDFLEIGNPDDPLQCALPIAGVLGVFSRNTKYLVSGNATSGFRHQEALSRRGTPAALATLATEYGIVFPHHDGIFRTNLMSLDDELSEDIAPLFYGETVNDLPPINWAAASTFSAAYRKGRYYFAYASGDALVPNTMAVLSHTTKKWYFFDHPARSLYREEGDDEALVAGFADGFVYIIEEGDSDAGDDIALDCETKDYYGGEPDVRKLFLFARVDADIPSGATLNVDLYVDDTLKRTASVTGSRTRVLLPFPEGSMGYTWRLGFRYTGQSRVRIYGASAIMVPMEAS